MNIPGALDRPTSSEIYINGIDTIKISEKELFNI
jgi:ABC-type lipoprotein export system ATPase subunit